MALQLSLYLVPLLLTVVLGVALTWFSWRNRSEPGATPFAVLIGAATVWAATYAGQLASTTLSGKLLWNALQAFGILPLSVALLAFTLEYTGHSEWVTRRNVALLSVVPALTLLVALTNPVHGLAYTDASLQQAGSLVVLDQTVGAWFPLGFGYAYLLYLVSVLLLGQFAVRAPPLYRGQALVVLVSIIVPSIGGALYFVWSATTINYAPVLFSVTGVATAWGVFRYRLFDIVPIARGTVYEELDDAIVVLDDEDRIVDLNPAAGRLLGVGGSVVGSAFDEAVGDVAEFPPPTEVPDGGEQAALLDGHELVVGGADGEPRTFEVRVSPVTDHRDVVRGRVVVFLDVTHRKAFERTLADKNARLEQFAQVVSHDLRNPLNVAQGYLEMERETTDSSHLEQVDRALDRMDALIEDVLILARSGRSVDDLAETSLADVAEEAWQNVDVGEATLVVADDEVVYADRTRLLQLFENLFRNSVEHATPDGAANADGKPEVTVRVGTEGGGFYVEDDGPGIPPEERGTVFEYGVSTRRAGTGFGLAIVNAIAEGHGWAVALTESEAGGARFEFTGVSGRGRQTSG